MRVSEETTRGGSLDVELLPRRIEDEASPAEWSIAGHTADAAQVRLRVAGFPGFPADSPGFPCTWTNRGRRLAGVPSLELRSAPMTACVRLLICGLLLPTSAGAASFSIQTIDTLRHSGYHASLAFDPAGRPNISYQEGERLDLRFARFDGAVWQTQTLETALETGYLTSLVFGPDGEPRIAYDAVVNHRVMFARRVGAAWTIEEVSLNGHGFSASSSLAIDSTGTACLAFTKSFQLMYGRREAGGWVNEIVDPAIMTGWQASLSVGSDGRPRISYGSVSNSALRLATRGVSAWTSELVDAGPLGGTAFTSLALGAGDEPRISYHDAVRGDLRFAERSGAVWTLSVVDSSGDVGQHSSLALDSAGEPWIAYLDRANADLRLAHRESGNWVLEVVDSVGRVGSQPSLRFDAEGDPVIAYVDLTNGALKLAERVMVSKSAWSDGASVVEVGPARFAEPLRADAERTSVAAAISHPASPAQVSATQVVPTDFAEQLMGSGLDEPTAFVFLPGDRRLVTQRRDGAIRLLSGTSFHASDPAGVIDSVRSAYLEQGLLGMALDPRYPQSPYLYVHYDWSGGLDIRIERYTLVGDLLGTGDGTIDLDLTSSRMVLAGLPDSSGAHNGGTLAFDPSGHLIVALGDDGTKCASQSLTSLRGKLLRLDTASIPDGAGPPPTLASLAPSDNPFAGHPDPRARIVWQTGLRNPYSYSIDPFSGAVFIADVGQIAYEEVDYAASGGHDFGWPHYEGPVATTFHCVDADTSDSVPPIAGYYYQPGTRTVIMGGVYRKPLFSTGFPPAYEGDVFYLDFYTGEMRRIERSGDTWALAAPVPGQPSPTVWANGFSFTNGWKVGPDGALWYLRLWSPYPNAFSGQLRRIVSLSLVDAPGITRGALELELPRPSPSRGASQLAWSQPREARVSLEMLDVTGRLVRTLIGDATMSAGVHEHRWDGRTRDGSPARPGLYLVRLRVEGEGRRTRSLVLVP